MGFPGVFTNQKNPSFKNSSIQPCCVTQWLGRRSVAGGPDPWLMCDHFVGKSSAMS